MKGIGRLFLAPFWIQVTLVLALFIGLFLLLLGIGWTHATIYLVLSAWLGLAWLLNIHVGAGMEMSTSFRSDRADVTKLRSRNDIAGLAAINNDPFLAPISKPLLVPVRSSLLTFVLLSGLWWVWICILFALTQVITGRLVQRVLLLELAAGQVRRDRTASALLCDLRSGQPVHGQYYIYLRPFAITGQLHGEDPNAMETAVGNRHPVGEYSTEGEQLGVQIPLIKLKVPLAEQWSASELNPEWEAIFEKGFRSRGSLVALGRPGESLGAGRIRTGEDNWQETLVQLSRKASGFLVVPSSNPGTLWEICLLRDAVAFKGCYFLVPGPQPERSDCAAWQKLREKLLHVIRLPQYIGAPAMFALDGDGRPHVVLIGSALLSGGNAMRNFIRASMIEGALETLSTVAARSRDSDIRVSLDVVSRFLEVLASGRENLRTFDGMSDDLRRSLSDVDDSALFPLYQQNKFVRIPGTEEVYHDKLAGRTILTVRQEAFVGDKQFVFYVTTNSDNSASRIMMFRFISYEDEQSLRSHGPKYTGSASDNPTKSAPSQQSVQSPK